MQTVELLLDPTSDAAVRAEWQRLAEAGLPSQPATTVAPTPRTSRSALPR